MSNISTHFVINPYHSHTTIRSRFPKTFSYIRRDGLSLRPHVNSPVYAGGTSAHALIYHMGHNASLLPLKELQISTVRQLRDIAYRERVNSGTINIIGIIDHDSPYGSRTMLEKVLRLLKETQIPLLVHVGVWNATPSDFNRGIKEIRSLSSATIRLASIFPVNYVLNHQGAKRYVDGLRRSSSNDAFIIQYPVLEPNYSLTAITPNDIILLCNHSLHGLDVLEEELKVIGPTVSLDSPHSPSSEIVNHLDRNRHILVLTNNPKYEEAYVGSGVSHPYYEAIHNASGKHILEMLISPHYGYHKPPYRTVVLLDEERHTDFDWLLLSCIKRAEENGYSCSFLDPTSVSGNIFASNINTMTEATARQS